MRALGVIDVGNDVSAKLWRKSTRSAHNGACVEVAPFPYRHVAVRDSKNPAGSPVILSAREWSRFIAGIKN